MKVVIEKKVGKSLLTFEVEAAKDIDALAKAALYTSMWDKCTLCGSENVQLEMNKAENFIFVKIRCNACTATSNLGQHKDGTTYFWKKFEKYVPQEGANAATAAPVQPAAPASPDIPF